MLSILILFVCSSLFFQCNSSGNQKDKSKESGAGFNQYFPVNDKSSWSYINEGNRDETEIFNVNVTSVDKKDDMISAVFDGFPFFNKQNEKATITVSKNGAVYVVKNSEQPKMLLPENDNLKQGYTWQYGDWSAIVSDTSVKVKSDSGKIYDCLYINYILGGFTFSTEIWYSKGTGIIKWGANRTNPPSQSISYYILK